MRIIVTGGAGFIGSAVCRLLIANGDQVLNVDSLTYAATEGSTAEVASSQSYEFLKADICNFNSMCTMFERYQPDGIMHLAAESHVDRSITGPEAFIQTNVVGTYNLLQAALKYWRGLDAAGKAAFRFLQISTDEVYGSLGKEGLFTENTPYAPTSPYSASKASADHLVLAWFHTFGLPVVISNCSNNYGPYHFPEKLIPTMIINALEEKPLPIYGDGANIRDWLFVDDHARALRIILAKGRLGEKYNVGGRNERTNLSVVKSICDIVDEYKPRNGGASRHDLISFVTDRPGHDRRYAIDASKLERELGWRAQETFETGLRRTVKWFIERSDWWTPLRGRHGDQRLGIL